MPIASNLNEGSVNSLGETSGLAASTTYPGFIWMHRDGYAADRPSRERLYVMKVVNRKLTSFTGGSGTFPTREFTIASSLPVENLNWEDMTAGDDVRSGAGASLYIGDIGNNSGGRNSYKIYQVAEPNPTGSNTTIASLQATWRFAYPTSARLANGDYPNCETMFLLDRNLYIVTKESSPRIYRFPTTFYENPGATHTLVQVTNGATTRIVRSVSQPSYGGFSADHQRFMIGAHARFFVYTLAANTLKGDALVKAMLLTPGRKEAFAHDVSDRAKYPKLNTEGATFEVGTKNIVFATEGKMVFHWPQSEIE